MTTSTRSIKVLFVCVENSARSQMAEAFARKAGIDASSAGTMPVSEVNPLIVQVMNEVGIDISSAKPKMLTAEMIDEADLVVTMGCSVEEVCPAPMIGRMRKKMLDWSVEDPKGKPVDRVRTIRNVIDRKVAKLRSRM